MKKTVIGLSLLLAGLFSGTAAAQNPATTQNNACAAEQTCPKSTTCTQAGRPCPFDQVTGITADQKNKLKAIAPCEGRVARQQARKDYLANVKEILTPEQYVEFLEITFVNQGGDRMGGPRRLGKDGGKVRQAKSVSESQLSQKAR